jgi:hypothetical protein
LFPLYLCGHLAASLLRFGLASTLHYFADEEILALMDAR